MNRELVIRACVQILDKDEMHRIHGRSVRDLAVDICNEIERAESYEAALAKWIEGPQ